MHLHVNEFGEFSLTFCDINEINYFFPHNNMGYCAVFSLLFLHLYPKAIVRIYCLRLYVIFSMIIERVACTDKIYCKVTSILFFILISENVFTIAI